MSLCQHFQKFYQNKLLTFLQIKLGKKQSRLIKKKIASNNFDQDFISLSQTIKKEINPLKPLPPPHHNALCQLPARAPFQEQGLF